MTTAIYTGPITIDHSCTLKFRSVSADGVVSDVQEAVYTILLPIYATSTATLDNLTTISSASVKVSGSANKTLSSVSTTANASVRVTGAINKSLQSISSTASGGSPTLYFTTQPYISNGIIYYNTDLIAATHATLATSLGAATVQAAGLISLSGQSSTTLNAITLGSLGSARANGNSAVTLSSLSVLAQATHRVAATLSTTLASVTAVSASAVKIVGISSNTLQSMTASAVGSVATNTPVLFFSTQPSATCDASGIVTITYNTGYLYESATNGSVSVNLASLSGTASALVPIAAHTGITFADSGSLVAGHISVSGLAENVLSSVLVQANGFNNVVPTVGAIVTTLGALTGLAAGSVLIRAQVSDNLSGLTGHSAGIVGAGIPLNDIYMLPVEYRITRLSGESKINMLPVEYRITALKGKP